MINILEKYKKMATKYHLEDLDSALTPGTPISNLLKELEMGKKRYTTHSYLENKGLFAIVKYLRNEISFADFSVVAKIEQIERRRLAETSALEKQAKKRIEEETVFISLKIPKKQEEENNFSKNDSRKKAKSRQLKLRQKYGLSRYIKKDDFAKLMNILHLINNGERLSEEDFVWLSTERVEFNEGYFTEELKKGYHRNEAKFYAKKFEKSKDLWDLVNASKHYRKCEQARTAESILNKIDMCNIENRKLKSAVFTTYGGVKRDLGKSDEALSLGRQAHEYMPQDFRPCTLIGAVYMEIGQYDLGNSWYQKAVERGYSEKSVDYELKGIFVRAEKSKQEAMRAYLLNIDHRRYSWANRNGKQAR
jgi:hypothetical protein